MTPIRLKMQAFGPYQGAVEIAFSGLRGKLFLITGSTGGGKTTILDAICFALFCRATGGRRTWQDMRNLSAGEDVPTVVDFEFSLGEEQYRFQRSWRWHKVRGSGRMEMRDEHQCSRRNGEQWELLASGAESRVREYAQRLLGLTCEQFSQVIVLPQGEFRKLLLSNSTEKSKIFQTLFQTEKWERITKCAQSMAEDLEQRCGGLLSARQAVLESEGVQASEELELLRKATEEEYEQSIAAAQKTENDLENISNIIQKVNRLKETETVFRRLQKQLAQAAAEKRALEQKRQEAVKAAAGLARLEEEKRRREDERELLRRQTYAREPRLAQLDRRLQGTMAELVAASLRKGENAGDAVRAIRDKNLELQQERAVLLGALGLPEDALDDKPACPKCGDTGWRGAQMCDCLRSLCTQEQIRELSKLLDLGEQSFDTFRLDYYSQSVWPGRGTSPRDNMDLVYEVCLNYAQKFGRFYFKNLFLSGAPGLGKTFLSACIARSVSEQGRSVVYDTAGNIFAQFETRKFQRDAEGVQTALDETRRYLTCDLLILDDLGSELTYKENGIIRNRANEVLTKATDLLKEIEKLGLFTTIEKGIFADVKRPKDGGKGLAGVVVKDDKYFNPFIEVMKGKVAAE